MNISVPAAVCMFPLALEVASLASAQETAIQSVQTRPVRTNFFSEETVAFEVALNVEDAFRGRLLWKLRTSGRTIVRGEKAVRVLPSQAETISIPLQVPTVKDGIICQ